MERLKSEKGAVLVIVALTLAVLLGFAALVMDAGLLYWEKKKLQNAMDAAVLAGAQELPKQPDQARLEAERTAGTYGVPAADLQLAFNEEGTSIRAETVRGQPAWFSRLLGFTQLHVRASARVQLSPLTSGIGVIPLGVHASDTLDYGDLVLLKVGTSDYGNFGALALTGPGAKDYETDLRDGFQQELKVGDILDTQTGNIKGPTERAITDRLLSCPYGGAAAHTDYPDDCPRIGLVPVFEPVLIDQNQVKQVRILGFASFFIERVIDGGAEVEGRFIEYAQSGSHSPAQTNYGTYGYRLVE